MALRPEIIACVGGGSSRYVYGNSFTKPSNLFQHLPGFSHNYLKRNPVFISRLISQAFGTVADPRLHYNSDYVWRTWGAAGLMVKQDINGHYSVIHASS